MGGAEIRPVAQELQMKVLCYSAKRIFHGASSGCKVNSEANNIECYPSLSSPEGSPETRIQVQITRLGCDEKYSVGIREVRFGRQVRKC